MTNLVVLMFLEDDSKLVEQLLSDQGVTVYSELPVQGHGGGSAGWYGNVVPFESRMLISFLPYDEAERLMAAVKACTTTRDPKRPIHGWRLPVAATVRSGSE
jgi:hypothetical protein